MTETLPLAFWVKPEPFTYGALPVPPHPRLTYHNIKKIVAYAKTKGKAGFPRLSYSVWKHIACNKLQLSEDIAWMYITTFDLVAGTTNDQRILRDKQFAQCNTKPDTEQARNHISVPTLEFVLFLFIQHLHKISLRTSLVSSQEEWPMRARSPELEGGRATPTGAKSLDEHGHLTFVLNNLNEIMELLVEPDSYGGGSGSDLTLTVEAVQSLGFLIAGSVDKYKTVKGLHEIALMQQLHQSSGYSKVDVEKGIDGIILWISQSFSFRKLQSWVRSNLCQNPFGISSCIASGRRLSWPLAGERKESRADSSRGRIATNVLLVPKDSVKGNKIIIMSQACKQTVARSSRTLEYSSVKIHRCHYSFIYLLSPLRSVSIEKCRQSTIVLGPVETTIHVNSCEQLTVIAPCRRMTISGSTNCTLHLLTPLPPLIFNGNDGITLAPYHTHYPVLQEHMTKAGLSPQPNLWDQPLVMAGDHHEDHPSWKLMSLREFYAFTIPFEMEGPTKEVPGGLPSMYEKALRQREQQIESWQKMVKEAGLSKEQRKQFQGIVEMRFQEWLQETGHKRELDGLVLPSGSKS